jgi:hypothetical protein
MALKTSNGNYHDTGLAKSLRQLSARVIDIETVLFFSTPGLG